MNHCKFNHHLFPNQKYLRMACAISSSSFSDAHTHPPLPVRSISLPSRIHPTCVKLESALIHLKIWQIASLCTNLSAETIQNGLVGLAELYNCIEELIHSPQTQQALIRHQNGKLVEESLDRSLTLLDTCNNARDLMLQMKQHVQNLQSALRRRGGSDSSIECHIAAYTSFKKKAKKDIAKSLAAFKKMESIDSSSVLVLDVDHNLSLIIKVLQEATAITISTFKSLLLFMSMPTMKLKTKAAGGGGSWSFSLISKLVRMRLLSPSESDNKGVEKVINEVEVVDLALYTLQGQSRTSKNINYTNAKSDSDEVQVAQKMLENFDISIEGLEAGLDSMFRCLVKNRVSFLNILTSDPC